MDVAEETKAETTEEAPKADEPVEPEAKAEEQSEDEWENVMVKQKIKVELSDGEEVEIEEEVSVRRKKEKHAKKQEKEGSDDEAEKSEGEDGEKNNKFEEINDKVNERLKDMAEREMKLIHQLYAETFIRRILRLVELFTSVAQTSAHPLALVSKVASPYMLYLLLNFMLIASPRTKLLSLRIVSNIINIGIPAQVFEQTIKLMEQQPDSLGNKILQSFKTSIKFENSAFLQFLFQYLLSIRSAMFDKQEVQSQGNYEISQDIARIFRRIMNTNDNSNGQGKDWNSTIRSAIINAFNSLEKLSQAEQDALFAIQIGADFTRISIGNPAITNQKQLIVVLGYSETDITGEISADNLKKHQLSYQQ